MRCKNLLSLISKPHKLTQCLQKQSWCVFLQSPPWIYCVRCGNIPAPQAIFGIFSSWCPSFCHSSAAPPLSCHPPAVFSHSHTQSHDFFSWYLLYFYFVPPFMPRRKKRHTFKHNALLHITTTKSFSDSSGFCTALHIIWIFQCVVAQCLMSQRDSYAHGSDSVSRTERKSWTHTLHASIRWAQHRWRLGNEDHFPTQGETRIRSYRWMLKWRWAGKTQWEQLQRCWQWWVRVRTLYFSSSICGYWKITTDITITSPAVWSNNHFIWILLRGLARCNYSILWEGNCYRKSNDGVHDQNVLHLIFYPGNDL